ncbi:MAG: putative toxin-antitoxin system toxin component, PIN family [Armatimonadetes bacterium]|nr:putative toxin-antitoxin system toxin component, PIN family [Armatimonadota bacterium]
MIVVLDTNILARGSISRGTAVAAIIDAWRAKQFTLLLSAHILDELTHTLAKAYFARRLSPEQQAAYELLLTSVGTIVPITASVRGVATQPADDLVLATAVSGDAVYLVTRDRKLLQLGSYQSVAIVSPTEFLEHLQGVRPEDMLE